jgi:hypothetical protein
MRSLAYACALSALSVTLCSAAFPRLFSVDPGACSPGDEVVVEGQNLDEESLAKLFLTAGGKDVEVTILEQGADTLRFSVSDDTPHGNYNLMVQTAGPTPALMEQPVRLEVADEETVAAKREERRKLEQEYAAPPEPSEPDSPQP